MVEVFLTAPRGEPPATEPLPVRARTVRPPAAAALVSAASTAQPPRRYAREHRIDPARTGVRCSACVPARSVRARPHALRARARGAHRMPRAGAGRL